MTRLNDEPTTFTFDNGRQTYTPRDYKDEYHGVVTAIFALGQNGAANAGFGPELLLPAYAAAFLGVTTYRPGYYNIPGAVIAILLMAVGFNGLNLLGAPFWVQPIFNGTVLVVAVICARAESRQTK